MHGYRNLHFSACMESLGRAVRLVHLFLSTQSLVFHHHILVCASLNISFSLHLQTLPSLLHHSVGPLYLPTATYSCGFHTLFSSIIQEQIRRHTHKHMQFLCQYTTSTTQVSGVGVFVSEIT